jgi:thymidine kinase
MEISQREEGFLDLVVGSMFSGKTEHLINIYNKFKDQKNIFVINHNFDNRYENNYIVSHNRTKIPIKKIYLSLIIILIIDMKIIILFHIIELKSQ